MENVETISLDKSNKDIRKDVWSIGFPAILESLFTTLMSIVDTKMVAGIGVKAISAVSVTNQPRLFLLSIFFALNISVSATVAKYYGSHKKDEANKLLVSSIVIASVLSIIIGILCVVFARPIMEVCSGQKDTLDMSVEYFKWLMGGLIFNVLFMLINSALRGCGYTKVTLISNIVSFVVNVIGNYLIINGNFGFPKLGVAGAAIATVISTIAALLVSIYFLSKEKFFVNSKYIIKNKVKFSLDCIKEVRSMWSTITIENLMTRFGYLFTSIITARIGSFDTSVYSIGMTIMNISFAFGDGLQSATVALIGQSLGANDNKLMYKYKDTILKSGLVIASILSILLTLFGKVYFGFFSSDIDFINKGRQVSFIIAIIIPMQICQLIYNGILKTLGMTKKSLIAAIISVTLVNPIVDYLLAILLDCGIWGIWAGTAISQLVRLLLLMNLYDKGG